jgi:hypothetical protein
MCLLSLKYQFWAGALGKAAEHLPSKHESEFKLQYHQKTINKTKAEVLRVFPFCLPLFSQNIKQRHRECSQYIFVE